MFHKLDRGQMGYRPTSEKLLGFSKERPHEAYYLLNSGLMTNRNCGLFQQN